MTLSKYDSRAYKGIMRTATELSRVIYVTYAKPGVTVYRSKRNSRFSITVRTLSQWGS